MPSPKREVTGAYEAWAYGIGAPHVFGTSQAREAPFIAALAALPAGMRPEALAKGTRRDTQRRVLVPQLWNGAHADGDVAFWPVILEAASRVAGANGLVDTYAGALRGTKGLREETGLRLNMPVPSRAVDTAYDPRRIERRLGQHPPAKPKVVVAVIEDGIPFAHKALRSADGERSRVAFCWMQSASTAETAAQRTVLFGREFLAPDIDALLTMAGGDEDLFYDLAGARTENAYPYATLDRRGSHGSHVTGLAAGQDGAAMDDVAVIAVQLPEPLTLDTAGVGKDAFILSALHYIFDRTDRLAGAHGIDRLPLVVNFSYGFTGGPHGGRDRLERAIRTLVAKRAATQPTHLVMPAGNTFHARLYGEISAAMLSARGHKPDAFTIPWRIQPGDRTSNYLELWLPDRASPAGVTIDVALPGGSEHDLSWTLGDGERLATRPLKSRGRDVGEASIERYGIGSGASLWRLLLAIGPTEPTDPLAPAAPAGLVRIGLSGIGAVLACGPICCRIQRDTDPFGYQRGARQSYLDDPYDGVLRANGAPADAENPPAAFVRRFGTLNGLATHDRVTVVGGFVGQTRKPSVYASGPSFASPGLPFSAPSDSNPVLRGVPGHGTRSGAVIRMDGTSVAAPQIARALARRYVEQPELADKLTASIGYLIGGSLESPASSASQTPQDRQRLGRRLR
ncbi:MAG TPA: S8 family serine peptidase [Beijerinckiaceae bacterium]|nr:S8 family serine peptidase [Beijerinckiaceae bacterium]